MAPTLPTDGSATGAPGRLVLERYRLGPRLGSGGFGTVWEAHDERLDRAVAIKRIAVDDPAVAQRAQREAKAAARLQHPAIVALHETGRDEDAVYLVSELVRGETLARLLEDGALSDRDVVQIGLALCDALAHAHGRGVIHRDVKPANVIVPDGAGPGQGVAKLTDFGVARLAGEDVLTRTGDVVGTLAYMAPEQAEGREAGREADLYALALVLYEGLAGVNPVRGRTPASTVRRVGVRLPALERLRRDLPLELCRAIDRGVAPRPRDRGALADLKRALKAARTHVEDEPGTVEAGPLETVARAAEMGLRRREVVEPDPFEEADREGGRRPVAPGSRAVAALSTGALAALGLATLAPGPPVTPAAGAVVAAALVALLPRVGAVLVALGLVAWLLDPELVAGTRTGGLDGLAVLIALGAAPAALGLWRSRPPWLAAPALAPALGLLALAGAFPAAAGQARRVAHRAWLGALGAWWVLLAELLSGRTLVLGPPPAAWERVRWQSSASDALLHAVWPALQGGALGLAAVWAGAAAVLPLLVRGRVAGVDAVAAGAWAAGLAATTAALAGALRWDGRPPPVHGLVAGAVVAAVAALGAVALRSQPGADG